MNQESSSQMERQAKVADQRAANSLSFAGDWLAPIIVWLVVMALGLAIAGFLLGED